MFIFYLDDTGENGRVGFAAIGIPSTNWKVSYTSLLNFRRQLAVEHRVPVGCELHATEFIGGRGTAGKTVRNWEDRLTIFRSTLSVADNFRGATLLTAFDSAVHEGRLFERLMNRINSCAAAHNDHAIVISDEGKNARYRALARRLGRHNPIPSRFGAWGGGVIAKNIPNEAILEDIIFRPSEDCRFIQLADFCAYALLRSEIPHPTRPGINDSFDLLEKILNTRAFAKDPRRKGIIRGT